MNVLIQSLRMKTPIALVGMGVSGEATLRLLLDCGFDRQQILTFDGKSPADFSSPEALAKAKPKTLCVSPGISLETPWIKDLLQEDILLTSELEIAFSFLTSELVISVTGSIGKSTTTSLIGVGARAIDPTAFVGGNLGFPLADYSRQLINNGVKAKYVILELSSYQLESFKNLRTDVSVFTFLSPNHLERYRGLEHYYQTKLSLISKTKRAVVINSHGGDLLQKSKPYQGQHADLKWIFAHRQDPRFTEWMIRAPALVGIHNLDNLAMAFSVSDFFCWPMECRDAMLSFPGLPHRLENCGVRHGILFLNDSKSTTMDSVLHAVKSVLPDLKSSGRLYLLLGGRDKNLPWSDLSVLSAENSIVFSFFGEIGESARKQSELEGITYPTLQNCLSSISSQLRENDILLLSPGGTSWDEFKNFEDRGQFFKNWILSKFYNDQAR